MSAEAVALARARVEAGDPDRFAAVMAGPAEGRDLLWGLYALNLEVARAPWASAEPYVAEMRLQWWIDALEGLRDAGRLPAHEIGPALAPLRDQADLLIALAEARRRDCWSEPFEDAEHLGEYIDATAGHLAWAAARALGAEGAAEAAVRDGAWGAGLAAYFLAVPTLVARGRPALPDMAPEAIAALAGQGLARLDAARAAPAQGGAVRTALLPGWQARGILRRAARAPGRVLAGSLAPSEFARRAGLVRAVLFAR